MPNTATTLKLINDHALSSSGDQTISGAITNTGGVTLTTNPLTLTDVNLVLSATTGTKIGTGATQKLGFFGATPIAQPSGAGQAALSAQSQSSLTDSTGGTADTTLAAVTDTSATDQSGTINDNFADLAAQLANIKTDVGALFTLVAALRSASVSLGQIKGSA